MSCYADICKKRVHETPCWLQVHLLVMRGVRLSQAHLTRRSNSGGARSVLCGTMVGLIVSLPCRYDHPWSRGLKLGGSGSKAFSQTATCRCDRSAFMRNAAKVGGSEQSLGGSVAPLLIFIFPAENSCSCK